MKIYLCKNTKNVDKIEKFLEQNLRKVTIEIKSCIGMCKYCGSNVVAKVDGKEIVADSAFGLLKEIRKILKKEDKLELIKEAKMKGSKKDVKLIKSESDKEKAKDKALELAKEKAKDKDKAKDKEKAKEKAKDKEKAKEKAKDKEKAKEKAKAKDKAKDKAKKKINKKAKNKKSDKGAGQIEMFEMFELIDEDIEAKIVGDEIVLTVPTAEFSLDNMKLSLHFGSFGEQNSTYEVVRVMPSSDATAASHQEKKEVDKASIMTFKTPELLAEPKKTDETKDDK